MWPFNSNREAQTIPTADFSEVMVDMHSHLLPQIDDGAANMDASIALVRDLQKLGYKKLITTPHVMSDFYKNTAEIILNNLERLKSRLVAENINIEIQAAAEYYVDDSFLSLLEKNQILAFGKNYILIELSFTVPPESLTEIIFQIISQGYKPVLAHPERYSYWNGNISKYIELKNRGLLFQVNTNSFGGYYGLAARKNAMLLADSMMIDFIGSDTHNAKHIHALGKALQNKTLLALIQAQTLLNRAL